MTEVVHDDELDRWRVSWLAWAELLVVLVAVACLAAAAAWVSEPVEDLSGCPSVVRFELAVAPADLPQPRPAGLQSIDELLQCDDRGEVGDALVDSSERDFAFIAIYGTLLYWCCRRMSGRRDLPLSNLLSRLFPSVFGVKPSRTSSDPATQKLTDARATYREDLRELRDEKGRKIAHAKASGGSLWWYARTRWRIRQDFRAGKREARANQAVSLQDDDSGGSVGWARGAWLDFRRRVTATLVDLVRARLRLAAVTRGTRGRTVARFASVFVVVAAGLDAIENTGLIRTAQHWPTGGDATPEALDQFMLRLTAGAAAGKFALLALPVVVAVLFLIRLAHAAIADTTRMPRSGEVLLPKVRAAASTSASERPRKTPVTEPHRWLLPSFQTVGEAQARLANPKGDTRSYGISLSGGGIRSATFSLGALQTLENPLEPGPLPAGALPKEVEEWESAGPVHEKARRWAIGKASYLSAVSGGSYMAASYQFLSRGSLGAEYLGVLAPPPPLPPHLPTAGLVEDHFRRNATHLADGAPEWLLAIGEILVKTLFTVLIVVLGVFAVGLPLGWVYRYVHYGTADSQPAVTLDLRILMAPGLALALFWVHRGYAWVRDRSWGAGTREQASGATRSGVAWLLVLGVALPFLVVNVESLVRGIGDLIGVSEAEPDPTDTAKHLDKIVSGTSTAAVGAAEAAAVELPAGQSSPTDPGAEALRAAAAAAGIAADRAEQAAEALEREADELATSAEQDADATAVAAEAEMREGERSVRVDTLAEASGADDACPAGSFTLDPPTSADELEIMRGVRLACVAAQSAASATEAFAAHVQALADVGQVEPEDALAVANAAGTSVKGATVAAAATDSLTTDLKGESAEESPPKLWAGLTALVALVNALYARRRTAAAAVPTTDGSKPKLAARLTQSLGLGGLSQVLVGVGTAAVLLIFLSDVIAMSWRVGAEYPVTVLFEQPLAAWWGGTLVALAAITMFANFNTWSLRPFYHRRLWIPYAVTPEGTTAPWSSDTRLSVVGAPAPDHPELLICAAAQTSGRDWAPPGRRALSFVLSADTCGGPDVGYVKTAALEEVLSGRPRLRHPVTLFGAATTSGAAFGPAMGRHSMGGIGAALAIANARLGAWMPNPHHLREIATAGESAKLRVSTVPRWPRIWYWVMEVFGQYPMEAPMVLVTDGGHVENLGLVELLRRRCGRIMCFDASGAGVTPATLAEAITLAREELNVEIEILPPLAGVGAAQDVPQAQAAASAAADATAAAGAGSVAAKGAAALAAAIAAGDKVTGPPGLLEVASSGADPLLRGGGKSDQLAALLSTRPVLVARIHYPEVVSETMTAEAFTGTLVYGTLALTDEGSKDWDLIEYAQRKGTFPRHGTEKQWFEADVFGAYHRLGRRTAERMVRTALEYEEAGRI